MRSEVGIGDQLNRSEKLLRARLLVDSVGVVDGVLWGATGMLTAGRFL